VAFSEVFLEVALRLGEFTALRAYAQCFGVRLVRNRPSMAGLQESQRTETSTSLVSSILLGVSHDVADGEASASRVLRDICLLIVAAIGTVSDALSHSRTDRSYVASDVGLCVVVALLTLVGRLASAGVEFGIDASRTQFASEPESIDVPNDVPTRYAPVVPDDAAADPVRSAPGTQQRSRAAEAPATAPRRRTGAAPLPARTPTAFGIAPRSPTGGGGAAV
jgi:hypothetical protein